MKEFHLYCICYLRCQSRKALEKEKEKEREEVNRYLFIENFTRDTLS